MHGADSFRSSLDRRSGWRRGSLRCWRSRRRRRRRQHRLLYGAISDATSQSQVLEPLGLLKRTYSSSCVLNCLLGAISERLTLVARISNIGIFNLFRRPSRPPNTSPAEAQIRKALLLLLPVPIHRVGPQSALSPSFLSLLRQRREVEVPSIHTRVAQIELHATTVSCNGDHHVLEKWGNRYASQSPLHSMQCNNFVNFMIIHLVDASEGKRGG